MRNVNSNLGDSVGNCNAEVVYVSLAILLYYAECGQELPDQDTIRKYQGKTLVKMFGIGGVKR